MDFLKIFKGLIRISVLLDQVCENEFEAIVHGILVLPERFSELDQFTLLNISE